MISQYQKSWLTCYDISDSSTRRRCLRHVRKFSSGYQKSCFELTINSENLNLLMDILINQIDSDNDKLLLVRLNSFSASWQVGTGVITPTGPLLVIQ